MHKLARSNILSISSQMGFQNEISFDQLNYNDLNPRQWKPNHTKQFLNEMKSNLQYNIELPNIECQNGSDLLMWTREEFINACPESFEHLALEIFEQLHNRILMTHHRERYNTTINRMERSISRIQHIGNCLIQSNL
ncbi:hypothetical protein DFA_10670 [Cavenderia fasciculata]|uniref:Uncharacterized protein n=1 Tax=Cavenderia fasciculata TaxID=261658 RepID=F4QB25_CACFS|nr:uncharacterized protein DFA_10670 [Cavenderia fasciculata]EGG14797.1 hypothetical protein DFA_10670 [Cavenderia fasciculata]|eukprot:XP_004351313.1 hypothetical protein DFA_10670 [Cavenderia fasciculata]